MPEYTRGNYFISTDPELMDLDSIFAFISRSYWGMGRPKEIMERAIQNSLCFGVFEMNLPGGVGVRESDRIRRQVGLARVVSDHAVFAYLCDVYILEDCRRQGLGKWLMEVVRNYPNLQGLRRWALITIDAHDLYRRFGFTGLRSPDKWMEIYDPAPENWGTEI